GSFGVLAFPRGTAASARSTEGRWDSALRMPSRAARGTVITCERIWPRPCTLVPPVEAIAELISVSVVPDLNFTMIGTAGPATVAVGETVEVAVAGAAPAAP